ncbi:MAG: CopD family protein [Burkholderiales bacterium]
MSMEIARWLHLLGVIVWVGGMFFAYVVLRPSAAQLLEPPQRLPLWSATLGRFFRWVWIAVALILGSGLHMTAALGGLDAPLHARTMLILGVIMMMIFAHVVMAPYAQLRRAVAAADWPAGGQALGRIRRLVGVNLVLGVVTVTIAILGRSAAG